MATKSSEVYAEFVLLNPSYKADSVNARQECKHPHEKPDVKVVSCGKNNNVNNLKRHWLTHHKGTELETKLKREDKRRASLSKIEAEDDYLSDNDEEIPDEESNCVHATSSSSRDHSMASDAQQSCLLSNDRSSSSSQASKLTQKSQTAKTQLDDDRLATLMTHACAKNILSFNAIDDPTIQEVIDYTGNTSPLSRLNIPRTKLRNLNDKMINSIKQVSNPFILTLKSAMQSLQYLLALC